ncbi:M14 family zinc carboxypeptidase [Paenibacillus thermoaerophilus]|uniref:M14 family zinc carboxypeptidase n=1 Tax=Paenibacillus thermoaerophilus TaxID=1215385 RepID=A0ABW2V561_9BACL|nr:M14 family metallopeptidase [Paenibacillus thermoaerophilus]TMV17918.1 LysM peptidoglycan-binding domain-containing protein [Paenibacillus thermoaerophilus]
MTYPYVVQRGDTLYRVARKFNINLQSLLAANPGVDPDRYLMPGQLLQIPARNGGYVVQAGDSFYWIARKFNIGLQELMAVNPGIDPAQLPIGQTLRLPPPQGQESGDIVNTRWEYGYAEMIDDLALLQTRYPFIALETIGSSVLGKPIPAVRIGTGERRLHYNGSFHANEWITTLLVMKFLEDAARAAATGASFRRRNMAELFRRNTLWLVPMVNPDGVELVQEGAAPDHPYYEQLIRWNGGSPDFRDWKANIRGVDLNDQFPAGWEIERDRRAVPGPGPRDWVGPEPLSEPESKAMADFTRKYDFAMTIAFHTQGREIYWNYRDLEPPESEAIAARFGQVSGYRPVKLTDSDAGYKDWFIQEWRRPGFTVEAGLGINPLPISQFPEMYRDAGNIMLAALEI